ncbi:MAG: protease modulator HflC [Alphaproteobacteria bacterium CG_4_9_14_3_um_filter_47_13]|nr:MAG: protease modulator HflC [Alphaproteobacteria bacterium CG_4_9_14_3_um_filter_47_13]
MNLKVGILFIILAAGLIVISQSLFTVDEREQAIVLQLGQPIGDVKGPGLHFKLPVVQDVRRFDRRILSVDPLPEQMVISSSSDSPLIKAQEGVIVDEPDQKSGDSRENVSGEPIIVDTFTRYRITDPLMFMKTLRTVNAANQRIESIMNDVTRGVLGKTTMRQLLSDERTKVMDDIRTRVNKKIMEDGLGIEIVDTRIVRADLTPELRQSTVRRMISELKERATETRAKGEERALGIRSTAEKERTVILAEAQRDAQISRGHGDEVAIKTYADAFNKDQEFYGFMRSMEAYKNTLANPDTRLILSPDSQFFKYFRGE